MMKKIIHMVVVILFTMPLLIHAQTVTIQDALNQSPGSVSLNIVMSGFSSNGGAVSLLIEYDSDLLEYTGYTSPSLVPFIMNPNYLGNPVFKINWSNPLGENLNATFLTLNFTYNGGFSNTLTFIEDQCEIADVNGNTFTGIVYVDGTITPDLSNPDGTATLGDVTAIAGGDAIIPLTITDNGGFNGVAASTTLRIAYDTDRLIYTGILDNSLGFTAGEEDGVITLVYSGATALVFPLNDPLIKLNFDYLGGGIAEVNFVSGSIVTDTDETILVTLFENGQVDANVPSGSGTLSIERKTADPGLVEVEITALGLSGTPAGVLEMKIAYDDENLDYNGFSSVSFPGGWTSSQTPGYLTFSLTNPSGFTIADGEVLTLEFEYFGDLANISFEPGTLLKDTDSDPIPVGLNDGWITSAIYVNTKVYLQGPWNGTNMNTMLLNNSLIPLTQPYNVAPWNYAGIESVGAVPADVVDWVLVELRTGLSAATTVARRAAFVLADGTITDLDGASPLAFGNALLPGNYYIVIKHRNHLAIISAVAQPLSGASVEYDFTDDAINTYGTNGIATLSISGGGSAFGMLAADANADNTVFVQDLGAYAAQRFSNGYLNADFNMDGTVFVQDLGLYAINRFFNSQVPF